MAQVFANTALVRHRGSCICTGIGTRRELSGFRLSDWEGGQKRHGRAFGLVSHRSVRQRAGAARRAEVWPEHLRHRRSEYLFRTVPKPRISEYEGDGWQIVKKNKASCRMKRRKSHDVWFEDRVWAMLAKLGWTWMNEDRKFRLRHTKTEDDRGRQIDVFAADAETALFVECKSAVEPRRASPSFAQDIQEISDIRKGVNDSLRKAFGRKRKTAWLFFTRNYRVSEADQERFREKNIFHIPEDELSYYEQLVAHLGPVAKYQLFGRLFDDQIIPELDTRVPALRAKVAGRTMYSFLVEPALLLKVGYVLHRTSTIAGDLDRYQRLVSRARLRGIRRYIVQEGGFFPNSVIVNIRAKSRLRFDLGGGGDHASETVLGILHLPQKYHSAMIIDGQHRLFGYGQTDERWTHKIPVVAFVNLPGQEQADMFVTINATQRSVPQNLLMTLRAAFDWGSTDPSEAKYAAEVRLVEDLNNRSDSMLCDRIVLAEEVKDDRRCLTLRYLQREGLKRTNLLASVRNGALVKGHCWAGDWEKTVRRGYRVLNACFETLYLFVEEQWKRGSGPGGFVATNASVAGLVIVIDQILAHLVTIAEVKPAAMTKEQICEALQPYLASIGRYLQRLDQAAISRMKSFGGGSAKNRVAREYQNAVNADHERFEPEGFRQWKKESTLMFNREVKPLCERLNEGLSRYVRKRMKEAYGQLKWLEALPDEVAKKAFEREVAEGYKEPRENYIDLADYEKIVEKNSPKVFDLAVFTAPEQKGGSKRQRLAWFAKLLRVRNKTAHPERDPVTEEECREIRDLDAWLSSRLDDGGS